MVKSLFLTFVIALVLAGVAFAARATAPPQDEMWLQSAISGDRFEIAGGLIAARRSGNPQVRALGRRLMSDHAKSLAEAIALAKRYGVGVPPAATPSQQWELNRLRNMPKSWFDVQYTSLEVKDHNQDIEETGFEARMGGLSEIRDDAKNELPVLNTHLKLAKVALAAAEGAKGGGG
jgi:putative membrane protein